MIIYKTTNLINGKIYIGKDSKNDPTYLGSGLLLKKAIEKYGIDNFKKEIIEELTDEKILDDREIFWILELNSTDRNIGYNIARGGTGGDTISKHPNKKEILENRNKKVSEGLKGHEVSKEAREKQSKSHTGWFDRLSEDEKKNYRNIMSEKMKDFYNKNEHHTKGKKLTKEHKEKLSQKAKENNFGGDNWSSLSDEERKKRSNKLSQSKIGRKLSKETKEKIRKSLQGKKRNQDS